MKLNRDELAALASHMRSSEEIEVVMDDEQEDRLFRSALGEWESGDE